MDSVWTATATIPQYEPLTAGGNADVVVIGGGLVGLTTAGYLAAEGAQVVLLEAGRLATRTSGRTTGKVTSQHSAIYADLLDRHGTTKARQYAEANQAAVEEVAALAARHSIECELVRTPAYVYTAGSAKEAKHLRREAEVAASLGLPAHFLADPDIGVPATAAVRFDEQVQFHPAQYLAGMARALAGTGGRIHEHTRAVEIDQDGDRLTVKTEQGHAITARHVVVATLLPFGLTGAYFARTRPTQSHGIAVRLPREAPAGMAISVDSPVRSTRPWPGGGPNGLIVVGGGHEVGSGDDTEAVYQSLVDWVGSTWNFSPTPEYRWSAHDYSTPDLLPYVGRSPGSDGLLVATGMHKWGLSNGTAAAGVLRDLVLDRPTPYADLYDARRIGDVHAVAKLVKDNLKVGASFATGHVGRVAHGTPAGADPAVKPVCTHMGCALTWNKADTTWDCNCHGSRFAADGSVLDGPATKPLNLE